MPENKKPFFSVVLPTKNRPALLPDAIRSVLLQDFDDFELIISDNFNDERTRQAIQPFLGDARVRYLRAEEELSMPEHWEFATANPRGQYVTVLTDRSVLKQGALRAIHHALMETGGEIPVCSWRWAGYDELSGIVTGDSGDVRTAKAEVLESKNVVQEYANKPINSPYKLPRGLNSCYRADIAQEMRARYGGLFLPLNPDYFSAFALLAICDQILYFDTPLSLSQGGTISNGGKGMDGTAELYLRSLKVARYYDYVPIKSPLVKNTIWNDLLAAREMVGGNLRSLGVDWVVYFIDCYKELLQKLGVRTNSSSVLGVLFAEWHRALTSFDAETQMAVMHETKELGKLKRRMLWRRSAVGISARALKHFVYRMFSIRQKRKAGRIRSPSVLAAAGFQSA